MAALEFMPEAQNNNTGSQPERARPAKVSDTYRIRQGDAQTDRKDILRLWRFLPGTNPPQAEKLDWFYRNRPAGDGVFYFLDYLPEDRPVAVVCLGRREFSIAGNRHQGVVFGDFAVEPKHRSLGPAVFFQKGFLKLAREQFDLVFGFPNELSGKVRAFGGYKLDMQVATYVRPLDFTQYLRRHAPTPVALLAGTLLNGVFAIALKREHAQARRQFSRVDVSSSFLDQLWARVEQQGVAMGVRNAAFFEWRLMRHPGKQFHSVTIVDAAQQPAGYLAYEINDDGVLVVADHLAINRDALGALLSFAVAQRPKGSRAISISEPAADSALATWLKTKRFSLRSEFSCFLSKSESLAALTDVDVIRLNFSDNDV
ncbi:MAG: hypothetical protein AAFO81_14190 [Pseudomonadota bacterium]